MKIKKSIHMRVIIGLEKGQKRIRCLESEFEDAAKFGIQDPTDKKRFVAAFSVYEDTTGGFFAYFSEAFKVAARKISEACIDCMSAGLKKGFSSALKFMRERGA